MHRLQRPFLSAVLIGIAACNGADPGVQAADAAGQSPVAAAAANARHAEDSFEVLVSEGPHAGTHRGTGSLGCMTYNGLWQAGWEVQDQPGLSGLMFQLMEVPVSGGSGTRISFTATFGTQIGPDLITALLDVHGSEFGRDGQGTVTREGRGAVIRLAGTAQQGGHVEATLRCAALEVMS